MELARNRNDLDDQQRLWRRWRREFPHSQWLAEALFSSGNMYMLRRDYPAAVDYYSYLAAHFPENTNAAAAHWRAGWLSYRQGLYRGCCADVRRADQALSRRQGDGLGAFTGEGVFMRRRTTNRPTPRPTIAPWSAPISTSFMRRWRGSGWLRWAMRSLWPSRSWIACRRRRCRCLLESFPEDSPHLAKARLLANAGLNEYIPREIAADPDSSSWSALAEAQIYASYGETYRAMRALKRALPYAATASIKSIPLAYWRILFPEAVVGHDQELSRRRTISIRTWWLR